ncbi:MAG: hypothetical protein U1U88_001813 [Lawsonella clevelandensis]
MSRGERWLHPVGVKAPAQPAGHPPPMLYPLLLIHGLMGRARTWLDHLDWFAAAANRAGLGRSIFTTSPSYRWPLPTAAPRGGRRRAAPHLPRHPPEPLTLFFTQQLGWALARSSPTAEPGGSSWLATPWGASTLGVRQPTGQSWWRGVVVAGCVPQHFRGLSTVLY